MSVVPRSTFVTVLAWIFIFLAGFATLVSMLQNVLVNLMFPGGGMDAAFERAGSSGLLPGFVSFMLRNMRLIFLFVLLLCVAMLASSIGMLLRQDWARVAFVVLMVLGIAWNLAGVVLSFAYLSGMLGAANLVITLAFAVLFAWIARTLMSPEIRSEFT